MSCKNKILVVQITRSRSLKTYELELHEIALLEFHYINFKGKTLTIQPKDVLVTFDKKGMCIPSILVDERVNVLDPSRLFPLIGVENEKVEN